MHIFKGAYIKSTLLSVPPQDVQTKCEEVDEPSTDD